MQVLNLKAEPNLRGGRIDLSWTNPVFKGAGSIVILRRETVYPIVPPAVPNDIGTTRDLTRAQPLYASSGESLDFSDTGLKPETVYYYAVIARDSASPQEEPTFVSAMATGTYETAEHLYRRLPALYQRHDTVPPPDAPTLDPADRNKGQLRRLIELFGLPFDLLRSFAAGMRNFSDVDHIDGALLRLLAQWIGWENDYTLSLDKQRNEIKYAPHYYRTTGIAANVRATINRLTTWDVQIREFFHTIARSNNPEHLTLWERVWRSGAWQPAGLVTLDVAFEGRGTMVVMPDGRQVLFYHARQSMPLARRRNGKAPTQDQWHLWYKVHDQGAWQAARRLTIEGEINKYPAAIRTPDNNTWVFWSAFGGVSGTGVPRLKLAVTASGRAAGPARITGTTKEPFSLSDGDLLTITIHDKGGSIQRRVAFHPEDFLDITNATAAEVAAVLNRELPRVEASVSEEGGVVLASIAQGSSAALTVSASAGATTLGLSGAASGIAAEQARLLGRLRPAPILNGTQLVLRLDQGPALTISFTAESSAADVAKTINAAVPGLAQADTATNTITFTSQTYGEQSDIVVDVDRSSAAGELGFGAALPTATPPDGDSEPTAVKDTSNNIWVFWCSRRSGGGWKVWYNRFDGAQRTWGLPRRVTGADASDRQPSALFDPAGGGRLWVFWSRKKHSGRWNIFYRSTTELDFNSHSAVAAESGDPHWTDVTELAPVPADFDRKDPFAVLRGGAVELFYSANQVAGWKICTTRITPAPSGSEEQITFGHFTHRAPVGLEAADGTMRLLFRSNETQVYTSPLYPTSITRDARYSGTTTVDTRNPARISLQKNIEDILHYTYDTGKKEENWHARDTIGIYLSPTTNDQKLIIRKQSQIQNVLRRFLPIQVRALFYVPLSYDEFVYTYDDPPADPQVRIGEQMFDTVLGEVYTGVKDSHRTIADFRWLRTWSAELAAPPGKMPDLTESPPDLSARLPVKGVEEGE